MSRFFILAAVAALLLAGGRVAVAQGNSAQIHALEEAQLIALIKENDGPIFEKAKACQRLAVVGTKTAIPALVALLSQDELSHYARFALEGIPDPAVDDALREELTKAPTPRAMLGIINSIGQRRDAKAVGLLGKMLDLTEGAKGEDAELVAAAARALARIGTAESAAKLTAAVAKDSKAKEAIGDAALACGEVLIENGNKDAAVAIFTATAKASLPKRHQIGAVAGTLRALGAGAKDLLLEQIRAKDDDFFNVGLSFARQVPGADVTAALAKELDKLLPARQALLLRAIGDRKERAAMDSVLAASRSDSAEVREAAVIVLAKVGDASAAGVLLEAASGDGEIARVAREGLKTLPGDGVNEAIMARLEKADAKQLPMLFELVAARRITAAAPSVHKALADKDEATRLAAIAALGQLVGLKELDVLASRALAGDAKEMQAAQQALKTAVLRHDRESSASALSRYLEGAAPARQSLLLDLLGEVSGETALRKVASAARSDDAALKDAATRVLGDWRNADAAPYLLFIARSDTDSKYQTRALRGYIRIARQLQLSDDERLKMYRTAMELAKRDDERKIAIDILTRIPSPETLQLAAGHIYVPDLTDAAAEAAVNIATKIINQHPKPVQTAMEKVTAANPAGEPAVQAKQLLDRAKAAAK